MKSRIAYNMAALALLAWGAVAPRPASAQFGSLVVNITAPEDGATVTGAITVRASVTIVGMLTVDSVQFKLDGANLGAADTSAPYSVNWDTRGAANGSHTLTAVARDFFGAQYSSPPVTVTVFNDTTPPTVSITLPAAGATVSGSITLQASASDNVGVAGVQFFVDGAARGAEDTTAPYSVSWDTTTATNGSHSITARARDAAGNQRTSSAVSVTVQNGPPPDTTRPSVSVTSPAPGATVSGSVNVTASASDNVGVTGVQFLLDGAPLGAEDTTAPYASPWDTTTSANGSHALSARARDAAGNTQVSAVITVTVSNTAPPPGTVTRVQDNAASIAYAGAWTQGDQTFAWSGGTAAFSRGPATTATLNFTGTQVSWIGWREPRGGIARVFLDGAQVAEVDLYAPAAAISEAVFTSAVLAEGPHTLRVEATGTMNAAASDTVVVVDAFDVTSTAPPPPPPDAGRHQEDDPAIAYAGPWFEETTYPWTDGRAMFAVNEGSATFTFSGTGVSWIGYRGHYGGFVRVLIDGAEVAVIDTYAPQPDQVGVPVYTASGLAPGTHTIRIELTGLKNPAADAAETAVDAFDVTQ